VRTNVFSWAWPYFYYSILDDCHSYSIHPVQCNMDRFRLLQDTQILPLPIMRLPQPSLWMKVSNVGTCTLGRKSNMEVTQWQTVTHYILPCTILPASSLQINSDWKKFRHFHPVVYFRLRNIFQQNRWMNTPLIIAATLYSLYALLSSHLFSSCVDNTSAVCDQAKNKINTFPNRTATQPTSTLVYSQ
jgi:hypothetical protein